MNQAGAGIMTLAATPPQRKAAPVTSDECHVDASAYGDSREEGKRISQ